MQLIIDLETRNSANMTCYYQIANEDRRNKLKYSDSLGVQHILGCN